MSMLASAKTMPWDHANVKTFDALRGPKLSREVVRAGCYERAIATLQSTADPSARKATVASLHDLLKAAGVDNPQAAAESERYSQPDTPHEQLAAETAKQEREKAKAERAQFRRERQQQRHEHSTALRQQRHDIKVKSRCEEFTAELLQQKQRRDRMLVHLREQQHSLQQQLALHQKALAQLRSTPETDNADQALETLQKHLQVLQRQKAQAEEQLELACQTSKEMSRRAASIEPEDGECTPSPVAADQLMKTQMHDALGQVPTQTLKTFPKVGSHGVHAAEEAAGRAQYVARQASFALPPPPPLLS